MKKLLVLALMLGFTVSAQAQWFVGGQVGITNISVTNEAGVDADSDGFTIAPEVGYNLNDRWGIGLGLEYSHAKVEDDINGINTEVDTFAISPFARFMAVEYGNFNLYFRGTAYYANQDDKENDATTDAFGVRIAPQVQYNLSDSFALIATLNFASLGFEMSSGEGDAESTSFGFGVDSDDVMNTSNFQIGFLYRF